MDLAAVVQAFAAVFPAELPDKTMVATIVLVTRYRRPVAVWCGTAAAYVLHVGVAAAAGSLLHLLPRTVTLGATAALFATGAVLLWRSAASHDGRAPSDMDGADGGDAAATVTPLRSAGAAFAVIAVAEWGDLSQLAIAGLAGSTGAPVSVAAGGLAAMLAVSAIGVVAGRELVKKLPVGKLQRAAAGVFGGLAALTLLGLA